MLPGVTLHQILRAQPGGAGAGTGTYPDPKDALQAARCLSILPGQEEGKLRHGRGLPKVRGFSRWRSCLQPPHGVEKMGAGVQAALPVGFLGSPQHGSGSVTPCLAAARGSESRCRLLPAPACPALEGKAYLFSHLMGRGWGGELTSSSRDPAGIAGATRREANRIRCQGCRAGEPGAVRAGGNVHRHRGPLPAWSWCSSPSCIPQRSPGRMLLLTLE